MTSTFAPKVDTPAAAPPDPGKHVNYTLGMVLGVDDFKQEFAYLEGRDQWLARDLLGYGTVCGLKVSVNTDGQVVVAAGSALSPRGQKISVPEAQCASLNDWLGLPDNRRRLFGSMAILYVVLCYRDCLTDSVPIPGEPCRTEEEATAASRIADDFRLELRFDPPEQREEDALRDFVAWLSQIEIVDIPDTLATRQAFEKAIRDAAYLTGSPPSSPLDFMYGSPANSLQIPVAAVGEYLRAAFRIWATELRPNWLGSGGDCTNPPAEGCLLLARLDVPIIQAPGGNWLVDASRRNLLPSGANENNRPFLMHLRMLQELVLSGLRYRLSGEVTGTLDNTTVAEIQNVPVATGLTTPPGDGQVLTAGKDSDGITRWQARPLPPPPPQPIPALGGDVTGAIGGNTVSNIQTVPVKITSPATIAENQVLITKRDTDGKIKWQPQALPPSAPTGNFVERSAPPRYLIVAAGIVRDGAPRPPIYNNLGAKVGGPGQLVVIFDGYKPPAGEHQYIVKVLTVLNDGLKQPIVIFDRFDAVGIFLQVRDGGTPVDPALLTKVEFMIEVSQYFK